MRTILGMLAFVLATAAAAQEKRGDPQQFVPTGFVAFGAWELYCGHFGDPSAEICDLRRTDILSPRPNFRAMVISWSYVQGAPVLDVGAERTTTWPGGGIKIDGERVIAFDRCGLGRCRVEGRDAEELLTRVSSAQSISLVFNDLAAAKEIDWELADLRKGLAALAERRKPSR